MSYLQKNKRKRLAKPELDIFLTTERGVFSWFKGKKIKFNPRPFSEKKKLDETEKNFVDFHLEMVKKIDTLIEEHEREKEPVFEEVPDSISQEKLEDSLEEIVEIRKPFKRKLETPDSKTEMQSENIFDNIDVAKEEFEAIHPDEIHSDFKFVTIPEELKDIVYIKNVERKHAKDDDLRSRMLGSQDKATQNSATGFVRVRGKKEMASLKDQKTKNKKQKIVSKTQNKGTEVMPIKKKKSKKKNELEKTRKEVEKARRGVEKKKKELDAIEEEIKKKEEMPVEKVEMKQSYIPVNFNHRRRKFKEKEKKELEKGKKLELKKVKELAKKKEKELKKKEKELGEKAKLEAKKKSLEAKHTLKEEEKKKKEVERQKKLKMKTAEKKKEPVKKLPSGKKSAKIPSKTEKKKTGIFTKKEKPLLPATKHSPSRKKNLEQEQPVLDDDIRKVLLITDNLLEKLPEDVIEEFVQSEDFSLYEKVISKYKVK